MKCLLQGLTSKAELPAPPSLLIVPQSVHGLCCMSGEGSGVGNSVSGAGKLGEPHIGQ